jgi:hypothetical protein
MEDSSREPGAKFLAHLDGERQQLLSEHLLGVSQAARRHADKIGLGPAGATIGLAHDLGKYSAAFQQYLRRVALSEDTEQKGLERGTRSITPRPAIKTSLIGYTNARRQQKALRP